MGTGTHIEAEDSESRVTRSKCQTSYYSAWVGRGAGTTQGPGLLLRGHATRRRLSKPIWGAGQLSAACGKRFSPQHSLTQTQPRLVTHMVTHTRSNTHNHTGANTQSPHEVGRKAFPEGIENYGVSGGETHEHQHWFPSTPKSTPPRPGPDTPLSGTHGDKRG